MNRSAMLTTATGGDAEPVALSSSGLPSGASSGHSYTPTSTSHDDNYAGNPTYTLYDDVVVS